MANIQAGDRFNIIFKGSFLGQVTLSQFCYGVSAVTGANSQNAFFNAVHANVIAASHLLDKFLACTVSDWVGLEIWYQVISPSRYAVYKKTLVGKVGTYDGSAWTANLAGVITRRGDMGNRKNVSTLHVPVGTDTSSMQDGLISNDLLEKLNDLALEMLNAIVTTGVVSTLDPVINNGVNATEFTPIVNAFAQQTVRVMRRRTVGLGI